MAGDAVDQARARRTRAAAIHADRERRTRRALVRMCASLTVFGLAPLVPGTGPVFGATTGSLRGLVYLAPALVCLAVSFAAFRRYGSFHPAYLAAQSVESLAIYGSRMALLYDGGLVWSVLWLVQPFTAILWGATKFVKRGVYVPIIVASHAAFAAQSWAHGRGAAAWISVVLGAGSIALFVLVSRRAARDLTVEAERDVLRAKLAAARLEEERRRIARALNEGVVRELEALAREIDDAPPAAEGARAAARDADHIATSARAPAPDSLAALAAAIDEKCRPLCAAVTYEQRLSAAGAVPLSDGASRAALRIAQELVRNAVTHARPGLVRVELGHDPAAGRLELRVWDDGSGMPEGAFARAAGGLRNARHWVRELGGTLTRRPDVAGTDLVATIPCRVTATVAT